MPTNLGPVDIIAIILFMALVLFAIAMNVYSRVNDRTGFATDRKVMEEVEACDAVLITADEYRKLLARYPETYQLTDARMSIMLTRGIVDDSIRILHKDALELEAAKRKAEQQAKEEMHQKDLARARQCVASIRGQAGEGD